MSMPTLATVPFVVDPHRRYSLDEWQTIEELTGERYEFHDGKLMSVRAMAGGSGYHALIGGNVVGTLFKIVTKNDNGRVGSQCGVYTSDLRIMIEEEKRYVYPDAAVICGDPVYDQTISTAVRNPLLVVEVMSPKSVSYDTGPKFDYYTTLESLRQYVVISQDIARVEVRTRTSADEAWVLSVAEGLDAVANVAALGGEMALRDVYRLVKFG